MKWQPYRGWDGEIVGWGKEEDDLLADVWIRHERCYFKIMGKDERGMVRLKAGEADSMSEAREKADEHLKELGRWW